MSEELAGAAKGRWLGRFSRCPMEVVSPHENPQVLLESQLRVVQLGRAELPVHQESPQAEVTGRSPWGALKWEPADEI